MRKFLPIIAVLLSTVFLTGCFDIQEKFTFKKGGNGSYSLKISLKESIKESLEESMENAAVDSTDIESINLQTENENQVAETFKKLKTDAEKIKGISNFTVTNDSKTFNYGYSFDFKDDIALNECLKLVMKTAKEQNETKKSAPISFPENLISFKKNVLTRIHDENIASVLQMSDLRKDPSMAAALLVLADMQYKCTYEFESDVKKYSNAAFVLSDDKRSLSSICLPFGKKSASEGDPCSLANVIQLK